MSSLPRPHTRSSAGTPDEPSDLRSGKRRRLLRQPSPTPPSSTVAQPRSFHSSIQDAVLARLLSLQTTVAGLEADHTRLTLLFAAIEVRRIAHAKAMADSLDTVNATLAAAAELTIITRRLSTEAIKISTDVREFISRYTAITIRGEPEDDVEMAKPARELFDGPLFAGLFEGIEFNEEEDHREKWAGLISRVPEGSNSAQIASSWAEIFNTFDPSATGPNANPHRFPLSYLHATKAFRGEIIKIIWTLAFAQLSKMIRIDADLKDLSDRSVRMRADNLSNWAVLKVIEEEYAAARVQMKEVEIKEPRETERLLDHVLQLVILSKGP